MLKFATSVIHAMLRFFYRTSYATHTIHCPHRGDVLTDVGVKEYLRIVLSLAMAASFTS